jgi:TfoX/Sxy family transcriptional regulator of competence genes
MGFDETLAGRVRKELAGRKGVVEKRMFGGVAFLLDGNMSVGIHKDELVVRVAPEETDAALREAGTRLFDLTGRPMKGWILVGGAGIADERSLTAWVARGAAYAASLPKKKAKSKRR